MEAKSAHEHFSREKANAIRAFKEAKEKLTVAVNRAKAIAPIRGPNNEELPLMAQLQEIQLGTVAEAEAALDEAMQKVDGIASNPDVLRQYEDLRQEANEVQEELDMARDSKGAKLQEIEQTRICWEKALTTSVDKVNVLFAKYMAELGCAGQVVLNRGTGDDRLPASQRTAPPVAAAGTRSGSQNDTVQLENGNFKNWGIEIQVKFREKAKFEVLSAQRQSGGERSVSTIMYLMALQDMMVSPFRFVDEINQGLDERNERLVFRRIVQNSTKPPSRDDVRDHCGQYFLITPKLLPNLYDMEQEAVTVHIITNGPYTFDKPTAFDPKRFVQAALEDGADESADEETSVNAETNADEEENEDNNRAEVQEETEEVNEENDPSVVNDARTVPRRSRHSRSDSSTESRKKRRMS